MKSGIIFDIQNLSLHDGPGLRTTVFLKGCPLKCLWCANPESQKFKPEIMLYAEKCVHCGACIAVCPTAAVTTGNGCTGCGKCVEECLHNARKLVGRTMTSEEVIKEVLKDKMLYENSNGGVTFSGGEALMQPDFLIEVLKGCKEANIHTVLDTTAYCEKDIFKEVLQFVDLVYVDLKCIVDPGHEKMTGVSNKVILENITYMDKSNKKFEVRMPIIPGYNDSLEIITKTIDFIKKLQSKPMVWLLPFHAYGKAKYEKLGMEWKMGDLKNMNRSELIPIAQKFESAEINVKVQ